MVTLTQTSKCVYIGMMNISTHKYLLTVFIFVIQNSYGLCLIIIILNTYDTRLSPLH